MNKQKYQSGNIHLILSMIIVIAILGCLGYLFWSKLNQSETIVKTETVTDNINSTDKGSENNNTGSSSDNSTEKNIGNNTGSPNDNYTEKNIGPIKCSDFNSNNGQYFDQQLILIGITFNCPQDWSIEYHKDVGFYLKSPDYEAQSSGVVDIVSGGSSIIISGVFTAPLPTLLGEAYAI